MSDNFYFHVETRIDGQWRVPPTLERETQCRTPPGEFLYMWRHAQAKSLFFEPEAWFPFRRECPPDWEHSELHHYFAEYSQGVYDDWQFSWLPFSELMVDLWPGEQLLISGEVEARLAPLFADGESPFPKEQLSEADLTEWQIDDLRNGERIQWPINRTYGRLRTELERHSPDELVSVSWKDTLAGYLSEYVVTGFTGLRRFGADADLRVISRFC